MLRVYKGYWNTFSLVAQAATLGNFFNLHKRKMAAFFDTRTVCSNIKCSTSLKGSFVRIIQFQC